MVAHLGDKRADHRPDGSLHAKSEHVLALLFYHDLFQHHMDFLTSRKDIDLLQHDFYRKNSLLATKN